ncbi:MAG: xanthine dehydrogenase family protein molybdopterin-binding subunit [Candidatus Eisenbacteria bacterium]
MTRGRGAAVVVRPRSVGLSVPKLEGADKVTGRALYVDDLVVPGVLHGVTVRSTIPHGRIRAIIRDPSFDWRGFTVVDAGDIPGENVVALIEDDQPILADGVIRHAEEPLLLLAHASAERARAALAHVRVEVEPLEPVLTVEDALAGRGRIFGRDNLFKEITIERGDPATGFAESEVVVTGVYRCGHQEHIYIENNGMIAERTRDGGVVVRGSLQCPYYVHKALRRAFGLPAEKVRVIQTVTGGGFGGKEEYPSLIAAHAALLAWKSGRPVKMVYDRMEDIAATTKRHPAVVRLRAGVRRDGILHALDADIVMDGGAYATLSSVVLSRGAIHAGGVYRWPHVRIHARAVATHTPPNGAFRGFGAPQTQFAIECHLDRIADTLGLDPVELRRRNAYRPGDVTPTGQTLTESVSAHEVLERTLRAARYPTRRAAIERANRAAARAEAAGRFAAGGRRLRRGIGLALAHHGAGFTGSGEVKLDSLAALDLTPDGHPRVLAANTEIGQGTITVFSQLVGEALGVPPEWVVIEPPDTDRVPDSGPTVASRTVMIVGGLLERCALGMREKLELFAEKPIGGAAEFRRVARRWLAERGPLRVERRYQKPAAISWDEEHYRGDAYGVFTYAACCVEVEVDLDTGETHVLDVTTAQEFGRAIHPVLAAGQIEGGTLQALGWALLEEVRWKDGRVWNAQLTNYIIPTSADAPPIHTVIVENPYSGGPQGAKGVGELPMDVPAPAVVAAIHHATGVWLDEIPITPERLLRAMRAVR